MFRRVFDDEFCHDTRAPVSQFASKSAAAFPEINENETAKSVNGGLVLGVVYDINTISDTVYKLVVD